MNNRYCQYGTLGTPEYESGCPLYVVDPRPLSGKKARFLPGGDAKLKSILKTAYLSNYDYYWRTLDGVIHSAKPIDVIEELGWKLPKPKEKQPESIKAYVTLDESRLTNAITYDEAVREGLEVIQFVAQKHYKTNVDVYSRANIDVGDLEQHLAGEVLVKKYLKEIEGGFSWFAERPDKEPWDIAGFRASLYASCWRASLAYHRKWVSAQKRNMGLREGVMVSLDAIDEDEDENELILAGNLNEPETVYIKRMVDSLYFTSRGNSFEGVIASYILYNVLISDQAGVDAKALQRERMRQACLKYNSDFLQFFDSIWNIIKKHVKWFIQSHSAPSSIGMQPIISITHAPDDTTRKYECSECTTEVVRNGRKVLRPRKLAIYECHKEGNTLYCSCGCPIETAKWVSRKI